LVIELMWHLFVAPILGLRIQLFVNLKRMQESGCLITKR
jgi:hypothetical protein